MNCFTKNQGGGNYTAPTISLLEVATEQGFANSQFEHGEVDPF